jgi:hypothetical protein
MIHPLNGPLQSWLSTTVIKVKGHGKHRSVVVAQKLDPSSYSGVGFWRISTWNTKSQHPINILQVGEMGTNMFQVAALKDDRGILGADRLGSSLQPPPNRNTMNPWKNKVKRQIPGKKEDTLSKRLWNSPFQYVIFLGAKTELLFNELFLHQKIYRKPRFLPSKNHGFSLMSFPNSEPRHMSFASRQSSGRPRSCLAPPI